MSKKNYVMKRKSFMKKKIAKKKVCEKNIFFLK